MSTLRNFFCSPRNVLSLSGYEERRGSKLLFMASSISGTIGGSRGGREGRVPPPPQASKIFWFHAVFGKIWPNCMLAPLPPPHPGVSPQLSGKSWICHRGPRGPRFCRFCKMKKIATEGSRIDFLALLTDVLDLLVVIVLLRKKICSFSAPPFPPVAVSKIFYGLPIYLKWTTFLDNNII